MSSLAISEFEYQFKVLYRPLNMYAMRILSNEDDSEDIVQQAFVDVWEKLSDGKVINNLKSYLYLAVRNRCLNHLSTVNTDLFEDQTIDVTDDSEDEAIARSERDARLWGVIDELPAVRRKIFLMAKREGLHYNEIAEELHLSVKTVENQMGKAMKALREAAYRIYLFFFG